MELMIVDRLMLSALLGPIAADVVTLRIVRDLQGELGFTAEEAEVLEFEAEGTQVKWNTDAPQTKEFDFKPAAVRIIKEQLEKASTSKKLTLQQLELYEKFLPEEDEAE